MPTYKIKGDEYDIPEDKVNEFEKDNKDAVISYAVGDNNYDIPVSERDEFLKDNKDARLIEDDKASLIIRPKEQFVGAFETHMTDRDKKSLKDSANNIVRYSNDVIDNKQVRPTLTKLSTKDDGNLLNDARRNQYKDNIPLFDIDNKINAVAPTIKESIFGGRVPVYKIDKDIPASDYDKFDLAEKLLFKSKDILEAPTRTDNSNAIANVFRGVGDNLLNDTQNALTFGVRDLLDNVDILKAVKKYDKGEALTKGEESLLDASATLSAVEEFRKDDMSIGYKGGKSAMEMLPVVVDFVVGKGLANKAVNAVTKGGKEALKKSLLTYFSEKAGKGAIGKVGSYAGKAAVKLGDAALMGTAMTAFQPVRATSDVIDRYKGNAAYGIEDNKAVYAGQKDKEKLGTAIYKSAASRSIENFTELLGGEFVTSAASKLIGNISDKITPSSIKPFINGIKNTEAWKLSETARRATGVQGFAPELLEEVIGIPINQLLVGDNNISELGTWEWWRDTGLQVGLVTMGMSSAQLPASGAEYLQGRKVRNMVSRQFRDGIEIASSSLGGIDALSQFDDAIKDMTPNDVQKYLISNFNNKDATRLFGYYVSKLNYGALMGSQEDVDRYRNEIIPSVEELMQNKYAFNKEQEKSRTRAVSEVGEEIINMIDAYPDESIDKVTEQLCERLNVTQAQALMDYVQDKKNVDNIFDRIEEEKQAQIEESSQKIISQSNKDTGDIISARMDDGSKDGLPVNIIGGTLDDGKGYVMVSYEDVDEDGNIITKREQVDQKRIFRDSLSVAPLDEVLSTNEEDISNSILEQASEQFSYSPNIPEPEPGIQFKIGDKNVQIAQIYPDGIVCEEIREDGAQGNVFSISIRDYKESFQDVIDNQELSQNNDNTVIDSNKSEDISNNAITANDDNINMSKEELPISTDTTKEVPNTDNPISTTQQIITDNDNIEFVNKQDVESTSLPTDKDGNILYHKLPIDDTLDDILDGGLSDVEVDNFVIANKKKAGKRLKKIQDNPPIIGINKAKYISDKQRWEDKISEAKQIVDYWDEVEKQIAEFRKQIGNDTFFDISSIGEPMNGDELAAMFLYGHKLIRDSYLEETGFKNKEASGMFGLFAKKENGGITIDRAGELLMLSDDEDKTNFFDSADANAGKNAIINVLSEVRTKGDLFRYIQNGRNRLSEREKNAEYEAYERWVYANYDMSVEDYENYEYKLKERIEIFFKYYDEYEINSIFADIHKQEDDDGRIREENEQAQRAEQGTNNGDIKGESIQGNESGSVKESDVTEFGREIAQGGQRSTNGSNENSVDLVGSKNTNGDKLGKFKQIDANPTDAQKKVGKKQNNNIRFRDVKDIRSDDSESSRSGIISGEKDLEIEAIKNKAIADNVYLKAPNGKPTKLNEKQWLQVRTKAFKDWFGDWEKTSRIEKLYKSIPIEITEEEYKGKYELNRDSIKSWIKNNLRGTYTNKDNGDDILLAKGGAQKVTSHSIGNEAHLKSIVAIPQLIEDSIFIDEIPNEKGNNKYDSYRYYIAGLKIDEADYTAKIIVGVKQGKRYYDHSLTRIEKGNLIEAANGFTTTVDAPLPSYADYKDTKLISILQINSSKVVDENGEPMVVYHGSHRKFTAFNKKYIGSNGTSIGQGFYFTNDKQFADGYSSDGGNVFEVFLNLRKELNLDKVTIKKGQLKKILKEIDDIQSDEIENSFLSNYDDVKYNGIERTLNNAVELEIGSADSDVHLIGGIVNISGNLNDVYMALEKVTGHDGIIGKKADGSVHFVVGIPNQIKSATDNAGPFSKENDDIRFRDVGDELDDIKSLDYPSKDGVVRFSVWENNKRTLSLDKEGDFCSIERVFTESGMFSFTSGEKIDSLSDVAYIFKNLENSSIENVFAVMVKSGTPTVIHLGMGNFNSSILNLGAIIAAYDSIVPDQVFFVHNHPSGEVKASIQDIDVLRNLNDMLPNGVLQDGIIINIKSGKFGVFNSKEESERKITRSTTNDVPIKLYTFDKQVFAPNFNPEKLSRITNSEDVARFISSHRLGDRKKISFLILNNANGVIGNIHTEFISIDNPDMISKKIVTDCIHFGGTRIILYGDFELKNIKNVVQMVNNKSGGDIVLLDGVSVIGNNSNYISAHEYGIMENSGEYKQTQKTGIGYVNKRFNEELKEITEDNADKIHFDLGMPSDALVSGGVENKPIKLYGSKLLAKIKKHGFIISELHDLPLSVASPIAVFNNIDRKGNKSVLTELKTRNGNFLITIDLGKGEDADFDIVSSVFGKNDSSVVNWIDKGYATYIDKKKAINYLHLSTPIAEASNSSELSSITKIIESFVNPTLEHGKIISEIENLSETLHTPIRIVKDLKEISDSDKQLEKRKRGSKGWFDSNTGEVVIVLPNTIDERDAQATVLHELVAHKGLSEMLGKDNFDKLCERVFDSLSKEKQNSLLKKYENNIIAGDEYMVSVAEGGVDVSIFEKIKAFVREAFRSIGIDLKMKDRDIKYMLLKSKNRLMDGDSVFDVASKIAKDNDVKIRFRDEDNSAKDEYENYISSLYFKAKEANQDSMLALKTLQDIIEKDSGKKIETYEDAYIAENHMSSKSEAESKKYEENYFKPLVSSIIDIVNKGAKYKDVTYYMIAKHGLERNGKFAERDAKRWFDDKLKELDKRLSEEKIDKDEYDKIVSSYEITKENKYKENLEKDYSGLSSLMNELGGEEDVNYTEFATDLVEDFENKYKEETITLWERTNAATKKMLKKNLESGMMSNTAYEKVKNMFEYYIPLRGWKEDTASDVYEYFNSEVSQINSTLKSANGRMSLADDPIATIGNMANSTILMGNRNLMKQNFLNMVINRPNEIAKVRDVWYENVGSNDGIIWKQSFPDIDINATPEEVERLVLAHEELMKQKESEGNATKNINKLDVGMSISNKQANEHAVVVKRNGKEYVIYINGNPRAAQAINGLTNPDGNKRFSYIDKFNRQLAANFTTRNPAFVLTNFSRDMIFAVSAVDVKENSFYLARFTANIVTSILAVRRGVLKKEAGNSQVDTYFKEFIDNGGETGYTALHNVDEYKKMIDRDIKKAMNKTDYLKAIHVSAQFFSDCNRMAEDVSRFNTYRTSREMGRSVVESIRDAKEITVNFNKKGAGYKTDGFFGITAGLSKNLFLFYNAGIQGLNNFAKLSIKHKSKFYTLLGGFTSAGFLVPMLNAFAISLFGDDDDKDAYNNLPEWVRRNNLCLYAPWMDNKFITIPLPIELRAFYGIGELCYQASVGNMKHKNIGMEILNQITELLPFNPLGQNGDIQSSFTPDFVKPLVQIARNKDFFGKPIYKENDFNIEDPEWTKIYNGTSPLLVSASKWLNEIGGGDKYTKGVYLMDWNPAKIEHVFENYFGGMGKTINQSAKTIVAVSESIANGEKSDDLLVRNIPVVNRFISEIDDRNSYTHSNDSYFYYKKEYDEVEHSLNGYKKEMGGLDSFEFAKRMQELISSTKYKRYTKFKNYNRQLEYLRKLEKEIPINLGEDRRKIRKSINELRGNLVTELDKIE